MRLSGTFQALAPAMHFSEIIPNGTPPHLYLAYFKCTDEDCLLTGGAPTFIPLLLRTHSANTSASAEDEDQEQ